MTELSTRFQSKVCDLIRYFFVESLTVFHQEILILWKEELSLLASHSLNSSCSLRPTHHPSHTTQNK